MATMSAVTTAVEAVNQAYDRIEADARSGIWIAVIDRADALARAAAIDAEVAAGAVRPLAGTTIAVKGNIDIAGLQTTAGCPSYGVVAERTAPAVRRLEDAGAVVIGHTNLDQFATGLVGTRSPYGVCPNATWDGLISGGSSSGSAVAVAAGHVTLSLGTDTAGSGRVPAAANAIVGLKPSVGRIPTEGVVPACESFDCISIFGRDAQLTEVAAAVAAGEPVPTGDDFAGDLATATSGSRPRVGVPRVDQLSFDGDEPGRLAHLAAVEAVVERFDAEVVEIDLAPLLAVGALLYGGALVAERYEAVGEFLETDPADADPTVKGIITAAADLPAWRYLRDQKELTRHREHLVTLWDRIDLLALPTAPRIPTVAETLADPIGVNTMLGTYTTFVNLLHLSAVAVPVGPSWPDRPPASIQLIAPDGADRMLASLADALLD